MQDLRAEQMDSQEPINEQASEIAALKEQMAAKQLSWDEEKQRILKALKAERECEKVARAEKKAMMVAISSLIQSPNQDSPAKEVPVKEHLETLSRQLQDLRTAQLGSQEQISQLTSENAALKEQMAAKQLSWDEEKQKILKALKAERECEKVTRAEKKAMMEAISSLIQSSDQDSPAKEVPVKEHLETLSRQLQDLRTAQLGSQEQINQLTSENAALKEQMATKDLSFDQEKQKMMKTLKSERERRKIIKVDKDVSEKEKDEIIRSLHQSLLEKQNESAEFNQVVESLKEENKTFRKNCLKKAYHVIVGLDKKNVMDLDAKLKTQQENFEKKLRQTVLEMESYATQKDSEHIQSEAEWEIKLTALEDQMRSELSAKEESFQKEQELQRRSRKIEEEWRNKKEEEIKLLTQKNADLQVQNLSLQELAKQTDKEKAQFKKKEKKARKEAEKILKKDRKEEEEREKKEKNENEKREKEELKRQKKERKENEKRQKDELKRQKKEKQLITHPHF